ncbi:glutathione S-transferase family protein [Thalassotalea sp. LPB0316]|uniref:glutathione S-transferase family protein n=1 Tax=Thalassotalea sp. LPB0316 TaxID=2769490 RepID=UPI001866637C|nr:glutathione S-transferase family protein [Thalassotalea sp. LPB0316]QOL25985.1 glutathione S-transferase family protein [Thalassotalea sp. LPB0316]
MKLIGSTTSPFVRRIRLLTQDNDVEFINIDIFSEQGAQILSQNNPAKKVPVLVDGDTQIYDSRIIFNYLSQKLQLEPLSWPQQNLLTVIDAANDSLVSILLCQRSGFDTQSDKLFFNLQNQRLASIFPVLEQAAQHGEFGSWHYPSICLFCLLDWASFRDLVKWQHFRALQAFYQKALQQPLVAQTDPRL